MKVLVRGGFTCSASNASRAPGKERPSDDAGRLKRYRDASDRLHDSRSSCALRLGGLRVPACAPVRSRFTTRPRQSRGLRTRRAMSFGLGPTRSGGVAASRSDARHHRGPEERDQRCVRSVSASQHSVNEHPYPVRFRFIVTRAGLLSCAGRAPDGMPPIETGESCGSRRTRALRRIARADRGGVFFPSRTSRATMPCDRASDAPVAIFARYRRAHFRGARWPIRRDRRDRFHHDVVTRRGFPGPGRLRSTRDALLWVRPFER